MHRGRGATRSRGSINWPPYPTFSIPPSAENVSVLTEYAVPSGLYFSVLTINLLTCLLTLQKKQLKQYIILCKTVADALKITILNTKTSSALGGFALPTPPPPTGGSASWTPAGGSPQTPTIGSRSRDRHGCVFDPALFFTLRSPWVCWVNVLSIP